MMKKKWIWGVLCLLLLGIGFWICRYLLLDWHGMKQWPEVLAAVGVVAVILSTLWDARIVSAAVPVGYLTGFFIGKLFFQYSVDSGGGRSSNYWKIWTAVFAVCLLVSIGIQVIGRKHHGAKT